jgi:5'-nucleotidase
MFELPKDLTGVRILVTNDDGIHAQGLQVLERIAHLLTDDVWVAAPEMEQSAASHSLTINRPLRLRQLGEKRFTIDGTPTDCVLLAINRLFGRDKPTLVLSGVNHGSNIGEDVTYSGTIAAAMEGTLLGLPSIALSQHYENGTPPIWNTAETWGPTVIRRAVSVPWPGNVLLNVNFPARAADEVTGIEIVRHGKRKLADDLIERIDPRGRPYIWIGALHGDADTTPDTDIHVVLNGGIAVTPLALDLTHTPTLAALRKAFA